MTKFYVIQKRCMATGALKDEWSRKRVDSALYLLEREVYNTIRSLAGLDTQWGLEAMKQAIIAHCERNVNASVTVGNAYEFRVFVSNE